MNKMLLIAVGVSTYLTGSAMADKTVKTDKTTKVTKGPKPAKMTCQEFVELEDVQKPKLVYWVEGYDRKGNVEDAVFDVDTTDRVLPLVVEECKKTPTESFFKKVKQEFKKIF